MPRSIEDIFAEFKINPRNTRSGREYYTCPGCSSGRTGFNRSARCLAVNIDHLGVRVFCNHCDDPNYHRAIMFEDKPQRQQGGQGDHRSISERAKPKQNGYVPMQKIGRAMWSRR